MKPIFYLLLIVVLAGCKHEQKQKHPDSEWKTATDSIAEEEQEVTWKSFPAKGKRSEDFIPKNCSLYLEAKGDLNKDGLEDRAIILKIPDTTACRPVLVLLGQKDKSLLLDKVSHTAMEAEYGEYEVKTYYSEDLEIENGELKILCYGMGPVSNLFSTYRYDNGDLILTFIETYSVGAGAWDTMEYNTLTGKLKQTVTNTMKEDMPETVTEFSQELERTVFEKSKPYEIIVNVYSKIESEE